MQEHHHVANLKQNTLMVDNKEARYVSIVSRNLKKQKGAQNAMLEV